MAIISENTVRVRFTELEIQAMLSSIAYIKKLAGDVRGTDAAYKMKALDVVSVRLARGLRRLYKKSAEDPEEESMTDDD